MGAKRTRWGFRRVVAGVDVCVLSSVLVLDEDEEEVEAEEVRRLLRSAVKGFSFERRERVLLAVLVEEERVEEVERLVVEGDILRVGGVYAGGGVRERGDGVVVVLEEVRCALRRVPCVAAL
jgi:hypothetical protein